MAHAMLVGMCLFLMEDDMQVIKGNYHELKRLKDEYELVDWIGKQGMSNAELWEYKHSLKQKVKEIMEGGDDI